MKKSRYAPEQVAFGLRQAEEGTPVAEGTFLAVARPGNGSNRRERAAVDVL